MDFNQKICVFRHNKGALTPPSFLAHPGTVIETCYLRRRSSVEFEPLFGTGADLLVFGKGYVAFDKTVDILLIDSDPISLKYIIC